MPHALRHPFTDRVGRPHRVLAHQILAALVSILVVATSLSIAPATASAAPRVGAAPAAASAAVTAASPDGRIDLVVTPSTTTVTSPGESVTWTYTVTNRGTTPAYQVSTTDTACGPLTGSSGLSSDGVRTWIPAGASATYRCTGPVDATRTGTATATYAFVAADGTRSTSTATATSTVRLTSACTTLWYGGFPATSTAGGLNMGAIGTVSAAGMTPTLPATRVPPNTQNSTPQQYFRAVGVDPTGSWIYYIPSGTLTSNNAGLYRIHPDGTDATRIVPASTREVTRPRSRRTSISGVAPTSPSTQKTQVRP